jgi:hypothetical protein
MTIGDGWDGPGLGHADISWFLASQTTDMTEAQQRNIISLALAQWAAHADITFTEAAAPGGNNQIDFYLGATSVESNGFDGYGYFPPLEYSEPLAGNVFIDDALAWTAGTAADPYEYVFDPVLGFVSYDLYPLLLHEIGHALGMMHPMGNFFNSGAAVMDPLFGTDSNGVVGFFSWDTLQADDIAGIQSLYAAPAIAAAIPEPGTLVIWSLLGLAFARAASRQRNGSWRFA